MMVRQNNCMPISAVFITFAGNCKEALTFYQSCFGGILQFDTFENQVPGFTEIPVVSGSLVSESIIIYGSDLVHDEGRKPGNHMAIYLQCEDWYDRKILIDQLKSDNVLENKDRQKLIEIIDNFDVRWLLGIEYADSL